MQKQTSSYPSWEARHYSITAAAVRGPAGRETDTSSPKDSYAPREEVQPNG